MHIRKIAAMGMLVSMVFSGVPTTEAQLAPAPSAPVEESVPIEPTPAISSASSSLAVEVIEEDGGELDIITDPVTTESAPVVSSASSSTPVIATDSNGPAISAVIVSSVAPAGAVIAWTTDEPATSRIEYGLTDVYGFETTRDPTLTTAHVQTIENLEPGATYHFRVISKDASGNVTISEDRTFTTASEAPVLDAPPVITDIAVSTVTSSSAVVTWLTDTVADSVVEYGTTQAYGTSTISDGILENIHAITLTDLEPDTTYHYRIKTTDSAGETTLSDDLTFTTDVASVELSPIEQTSSQSSASSVPSSTAAVSSHSSSSSVSSSSSHLSSSSSSSQISSHISSHSSASSLHSLSSSLRSSSASSHTSSQGLSVSSVSVVIVPVLSNVTVTNVGTSDATISWATNESADSRVQYGLTPSYGAHTTLTTDSDLMHSHTIENLMPDRTYHYRIQSQDSDGNLTMGIDRTFTTASSPYASGAMSEPVISDVTDRSLVISWTVPFDDTELLESYDIRYGIEPITEENFVTMNSVNKGEEHLTLFSDGSTEHSLTVTGLNPLFTYYFAIKSDASLSDLAELEEETVEPDVSPEEILQAIIPVSSTPNIPIPSRTTGRTNPVQNIPSPRLTTPSTTNGGGGGRFRLPKPKTVQAKAADGEVAIFWSNPAVSPFIQTRIVRKVGSFPMSPKDGEIIFEGKSQTFTDTEVTNDREYHYAIYTHNLGRKYSPPVLLSMVPTDGVEQYTVKAPLLRNRTATVTSPFSHDLVFGMTDSDVRALQRLLSQDTSLYPEGAVTGYFGPLTLAAVKRTQERYDLPQTGIVDASTRNALLHLVDPITSVPHAVAWDHDLAKGAQGDDVKALQQLLINEDVFPEKLVTGYFRILTQQALTRFQRKYNLPTTGILDQTTRAQIRSMKNQ